MTSGCLGSFNSLLSSIPEKKRYRESYISDDLDMDPPGSESSPGLSRHSTSSSGIEADARQHSISTEMTSMEEDGQRQGEKGFSSVVSRSSSHTSGFDTGIKARTEDERWQGEGERIVIPNGNYFSAAVCCMMCYQLCDMLIMSSQLNFLYGLYVDVFFVLDTFQ